MTLHFALEKTVGELKRIICFRSVGIKKCTAAAAATVGRRLSTFSDPKYTPGIPQMFFSSEEVHLL